MNKKTKTILIVGIILLLLAAAVIARFKSNSSELAKRPSLLVNIVTGKAVRGDIELTETLNGDILPIQQANIYSKVSGNIEKVYVNIGDYVREGSVLALIDTTIYSQNAKQTNAVFNQALANLANAKLNYERNKSLLEQNLIAKQDVDNSKTAYDVALAQKEAAYANYSNTITQLEYCKIKAPFSGYITKRYLDAGVYVVSSTNSPSSTLFVLMDLTKLKAMINVPEKNVMLLTKIQEIIVSADALPGMKFNAVINKIGEAVDLSTRTMPVEIYVENSLNQLKPGMFANINLVLAKKSNTLILPNETVLNDQKGNFVFITNPDSTVSKKYVQVGIQHNNKDEIVSGIDDSDKIVFTGQSLVRDRAKVRISK